MKPIQQVLDFHEEMEENSFSFLYQGDISLVYDGEVNQAVIKAFAGLAEDHMVENNEETKVKKRVFHAMVETLQNIAKHSKEFRATDEGRIGLGTFVITNTPNGYSITSGNFINTNEVNEITHSLDQINRLDTAGVKDLYLKKINEGGLSSKGGAGLGFIDIAKKTKTKFEYDFMDMGDESSYFMLKLKIMKDTMNNGFMSQLIIDAKEDYPGINFNRKKGNLQISGSSFMEDASSFFQPVFDWVDAYCADPFETTIITFKLKYFNTASSKAFLDIMKRFVDVKNSKVKIKWYVEKGDEDMEEAGEEYKEIVNCDFEVLQYSN